MKNFKKFVEMYISDFNAIAETGKKDNVPNAEIESLQEKYLEALVRSVIKCANMPKEVKLKIIERVKNKIGID